MSSRLRQSRVVQLQSRDKGIGRMYTPLCRTTLLYTGRPCKFITCDCDGRHALFPWGTRIVGWALLCSPDAMCSPRGSLIADGRVGDHTESRMRGYSCWRGIKYDLRTYMMCLMHGCVARATCMFVRWAGSELSSPHPCTVHCLYPMHSCDPEHVTILFGVLAHRR